MDIKKLANVVSISDIVSEATEVKPETINTVQQLAKDMFRETDFSRSPEPEPEPEPEPYRGSPRPDPEYDDDEDEDEEEYDAAENAHGLVHTLLAVDSIILSAVCVVKSRHNAGGGRVIKKMKAAYLKKMSGATLSDAEKNLMTAFETYKADMKLLSDRVTIKEKDTEKLIALATNYCQVTKFKTGPALAFWANYVGSLTERITQIIIE